MHSKKVNIAFFVLGLAVFGYLLHRFGLQQILANIERAGWSLLYIIGIWFGIYLLNTAAWKLVLGVQRNAISFRRLFMVTVSGFVINYITPVVAIGGEPYKVKALAGDLGTGNSLSAVVLYRLVHLLGHMLLLLTGLLAALLFLDLSLPIQMLLAATGICIVVVIVLTLGIQRQGIFQRLYRFLQRFKFLRRLVAALERYEQNLHGMDETITNAYRNERSKFYGAIFLEYLSRFLMGVEVYLILQGVGVETTLASALFLYVSYSLIINVLFFVPLNLGAREGGLALGLGSLALPPLLGVYLGVVMRIREFFWILLGLFFILITSEKKEAPRHATGRIG